MMLGALGAVLRQTAHNLGQQHKPKAPKHQTRKSAKPIHPPKNGFGQCLIDNYTETMGMSRVDMSMTQEWPAGRV